MRPLDLLSAAALLALSANAYAAPPVKACALLSPATAAAMFGASLQPPLDANIACIFKAKDGTVNINIIQAPDGAPADMMSRAFPGLLHKEYATDTVESIPGLGEQNRFIHSTEKDSLQVLYHNAILQLIVDHSKNPKLKAAMIDVAKSALAHW